MALIIVSVLFGMAVSPMAEATPNREVEVQISLGPDGVSDEFSILVPDGEILTELDFKMFEKPWPIDDVVTIRDKSDWMLSSSMDGVDYNLSGLRILPMSHEWDFEGSAQGWVLESGGGWAHGYDSSLGPVNGVHSGTSAIYTYNSNYPSNMGLTYWATSPTVDCSSCSGTWDLKFWKRLGVESSYYDHAYVSVKSSNGGWINVYSNPTGTVNDGSYTQSTYDISNYVTGNSAFQVRFGLGRTDGSVQYTGWNIDDVVIEPRGNTGTGIANWTSLPFGPEGLGQMNMEHGLLSIDATIPPTGMMKWSLIDSNDGTVIPGFSEVQDLTADLSIIDTKKHPLVELKIQMETTSETPIIHAIKLGGGIIESFNGTINSGWSGYTTQNNGVVTGTGMLYSPEWRMGQSYSAIELDWSGSGTGSFEACYHREVDCSTQWIKLEENRKINLPQASNYLNLRWNGTGTYSIDYLELDLHRNSPPLNPRIDIGLDGVNEWSFSGQSTSNWGLQDRFASGNKAIELAIEAGGYDLVNLYYPAKSGSPDSSYDSKGNMMFSLSAIGAPVDGVEVTFSIAGNEILTQQLGFIMNSKTIILTDSQMQDLQSEISSRIGEYKIIGDLYAHEIEVSISSTSGGYLQISGLSIPYRYDVHIEGDDSKPIIDAINSQLSQIIPKNGMKEVPIPIKMSNPGGVEIWDYGMQTLGSPKPVGITMKNQTDTLVAGEDWYEFSSAFDLSVLGVSDSSQHFSDESWSSVFTLGGSKWSRSIDCSVVTNSCVSDQGIILDDFSHSFNGSTVEFNHRLQISSIWPDEEALVAKSSINMNGPASEANQIRFGLGYSMAVEQDVTVIDWRLSFMNGATSTWDALYFDPSNPGIVEVELAFDGLKQSPRSSAFNIALYVDGLIVDTTQELANGVATLTFTPNQLATKVDLAIGVSGLYGQNVNWSVPKNATFLMDQTSPILISSNIAPLDHRSNELPMQLEFLIGDRPLLPRHSILHVDKSWAGKEAIMLNQPQNLNGFQGTYSTIVDVSNANIGDTMSGWLEVFDPAGHPLPDSGNEESPLFIVSFGPDGAPVILSDGLGWVNSTEWFHPGQNFSMQIPIVDSNGYGDMDTVTVDLSSGSSENLVVEWNSQTGCVSSNPSVVVERCLILGDTHHFDEFFILEIVISFAWNFNPDTSVERSVQITAQDDSGQSSRVELVSKWRYSSEMEVDINSASFVNSTEFVAPGQVTGFSVDIIWTKSAKLVQPTIDVSVNIDEFEQFGISENGVANMQLVAPNSTGIYPITLDLKNLPVGAIDRTNSVQVVSWLVVDSNIPRVVQMVSPDQNSEIKERDWQNLEFEIMINETEGLDLDSIYMHWLLLPSGISIPGMFYGGGNVSMELIAGTGSGPSIPMSATLDVESLIPELSRENSWDLWVWVEGQDLAGQKIDASFNSRESPLAVLSLESRDADLQIDSELIKVSKTYMTTGRPAYINITVENTGLVEGSTSIRVEVIEDGDSRRQLEVVQIEVPAMSTYSFEVKWIPEKSGTAWVEVSSPGGIFEKTDPIQIESGESSFPIEALEDASGPMLTGFSIIVFLMVGLLGYLIMTGKKSEEYGFEESEFN